MTIAKNKLSQRKDIAGSRNQTSSLNIADEPNKLGQPISGQSGSSANILGSAPDMIITGLSGMTEASSCKYLTLSGSNSLNNNGTFLITEVLSSTSVIVENPFGISIDANNGSISWVERNPYSLEDDLNYQRSDRANIKGVDYFEEIPKYVRPEDQTTEVSVNLANIAGKTTDAKTFIDNIKYYSVSANSGDSFLTLSAPGELKHADNINIIGIPINDGYDSGNHEATFVSILSGDGYETELSVLESQGAAQAGWRIFGRTRAGSSSSPNSVEIELRAVEPGQPLSTSVPYIWEGQANLTNVIIGNRTSLNNLNESSFRKTLLFGTTYGGQSNESGGGGGVSLPINASDVIVDTNNLNLSSSSNLQTVLEDLDGYISENLINIGDGYQIPVGVGSPYFIQYEIYSDNVDFTQATSADFLIRKSNNVEYSLPAVISDQQINYILLIRNLQTTDFTDIESITLIPEIIISGNSVFGIPKRISVVSVFDYFG